jgi:hypothetical protein
MNEKELQNNIESLKASYDSVSLSSEEKSFIKESVLSEIDKRIASQKVPSPFWYFRNAGVAFLMFILIGAPMSFAAERSLPGDVLYKVKTDFNESVAEIITPEEKKADFYQSLIVKRVDEIKKVSEKEEVTTEDVEDFKEVLLEDVEKAVEFSKKPKKITESKEEILEDRKAVVLALEEVSDLVDKIEEETEVVSVVATTTINIETENAEAGSVEVEKMEYTLIEVADLIVTESVEASTTESVLDGLIVEAEVKIEKLSKEFLDNE